MSSKWNMLSILETIVPSLSLAVASWALYVAAMDPAKGNLPDFPAASMQRMQVDLNDQVLAMVEADFAPRSENSAGFATDVGGLNARLEAVEAKMRGLSVLANHASQILYAGMRGSLYRELLSAQFYVDLIDSPESTLEQRAEAFMCLGALQCSSYFLDERVQLRWIQDSIRAVDGDDAERLAATFTVTPGIRMVQMELMRTALHSRHDGARGLSLRALANYEYDDTVMDVIEAAKQDPSHQVREIAWGLEEYKENNDPMKLKLEIRR